MAALKISYKIYLEAEGYHTVCAGNGREALERVREEELHLVLMDIMMPVQNTVLHLICG